MDVHDIDLFDPFDDFTGDFSIVDSNILNQFTLITASPGHFYQWPTLGADIRSAINAPVELQFFRARVIAEFGKDGYELTVYDFEGSPDGFTVDIDAIKIR